MTKISILGDSYSTFKGYEKEEYDYWYPNPEQGVVNVEETWWHMLCAEMDLELVNNCSYSGSTVCNTGYGGEDSSYSSFITRLDNDLRDCKSDIIIIFGGTNDFWAGSPVGEIKLEDFTSQDLKSFAPAFYYMIKKIIEYNKDTKIYNVINDEIPKYLTSIMEEVCDKYSINTISLTDIDKINGHPTKKGMYQIKEQIKSNIK